MRSVKSKAFSNFGFKAKYKPNSRLFDKSLGGGSIFDLGCYARFFYVIHKKSRKN